MTTTAPFLRSVAARPSLRKCQRERGFPFDLALFEEFEELELGAPVVFLVGENGTGKSTLLEVIAVLMSCSAMGSEDLERDPTLLPARRLAEHLMVRRTAARPRASTFFRAEDAFGFTRRLIREQAELADLEQEFAERFEEGSWAQRLATGVARGQRRELAERYGEDPDARSHGESFLALLERRIRPSGFYVLDEPETPLSPVRILALLRLLRRWVNAGSQFLIATHSPLLLALPEAQILSCDGGRLEQLAWQDVPHVQLVRSFLARPEAYLRLLDEE